MILLTNTTPASLRSAFPSSAEEGSFAQKRLLWRCGCRCFLGQHAQLRAVRENGLKDSSERFAVLHGLHDDGDFFSELERVLAIPDGIDDVRRLSLGDPVHSLSVVASD